MQAARKPSVPLSKSTPCPELKVLASIPRSVSAIYSHMNVNMNVMDAQPEQTRQTRHSSSRHQAGGQSQDPYRTKEDAAQGGSAGRQGRAARCWLPLVSCRWVLLTMRECIATM